MLSFIFPCLWSFLGCPRREGEPPGGQEAPKGGPREAKMGPRSAPGGRRSGPRGPKTSPRAAQSAPRSSQSTKIKKYRILQGFSWDYSVFAWFGCIIDPQNAAKSSENAGVPAETSYFTRVLGCMFTLFSSPGKLQNTYSTCVQPFQR